MTVFMRRAFRRWRKALREFAEVQVVAPDRNRSGASNSLTLETSLRTFTYPNGDIAVQMGTPTDCVFSGCECADASEAGYGGVGH